MKRNFKVTGGIYLALMILSGCSSSSNLRRFDEGDIGKEISADVAKKFEVREVEELSPTAASMAAETAEQKAAAAAKKKAAAEAKKKGKSAVKAEAFSFPNRRPTAMPFEVGERLSYDIRFVGVSAATMKMEILAPKIVNERKVYHIKAQAKTASLFELVYRVNDQIESYFDYEGLFSHRFAMDLDESKQSRKLIELYDYEKKKSFFWNRIDHTERGYAEQKAQYDIPLWSQDPISTLYYVRTVTLPKDPAKPFRFPFIIDGKAWEGELTYQKPEKIYAGGKHFDADLYMMATYHNGEPKNKDIKVWVSTNEKHYVLRLEAKLKVGSFAIALDEIL